jgi:hypothetical protein
VTQLRYRSYPSFLKHCLALSIILLLCGSLSAQQDTSAHRQDTSARRQDTAKISANAGLFNLKSKGLIGKLAKSITSDTVIHDNNVQRIDKLYNKYKGRIIRHIEIRRVDFGVPINDTTRNFKNMLTRAADALHHTTREYIIKNNLFFKEGDTLLPILLADNERQLRDQNYIGDAKIIVKSVLGTRDSVDIIVLAKDVLSLGGSLNMSSITKMEAVAREDNFIGLGDRLQLSGFYDKSRTTPFGFGAEYEARNIAGTFADATLGIKTYAPTFNTGHKQEATIYASYIRPLVNPYMKWTYAFEAALHNTSNLYFADTSYQFNYQYKFYNIDAWAGFNMNSHQFKGDVKDDRLRTLVGIRFIHQDFTLVPRKYEHSYFYQYANLTGVLASISIFRQDFNKTQFVYGFGRNEDVPEGLDFSVTTGWTDKQNRVRPYMGIDMTFNYFTKKGNYFNYTLRAGGYSFKKQYEDISLLANLEYFSRLKTLSSRWKQRTFITASITSQINKQLNEPLLLESQYGLQEYQDIHLGGDHRVTVKAESVFFNNWTLFSFKFAPFVFGNGSLLTPVRQPIVNTKFYNTIGAGLRSRNESLVFGTLEFRTYYFPGQNFNGDSFRFEFNSNIKFKYNTLFIRRPNFITLN